MVMPKPVADISGDMPGYVVILKKLNRRDANKPKHGSALPSTAVIGICVHLLYKYYNFLMWLF